MASSFCIFHALSFEFNLFSDRSSLYSPAANSSYLEVASIQCFLVDSH